MYIQYGYKPKLMDYIGALKKLWAKKLKLIFYHLPGCADTIPNIDNLKSKFNYKYQQPLRKGSKL